jgi:adenosylcobinamide kinase/adenosylcobinamide-phosphate guanylyltransferase
MGKMIFVTGGARSGKSRFAESLAESFGAPLCYIATCEARDPEMAERIAAHQARRTDAWLTVEEPLRLAEALKNADGRFSAMLVDCVTLWLSNLILCHEDDGRALAEARLLEDSIAALETPLILVSNEVGMGIVPDNALARAFRDLAGRTNQILAAAADEVYVMISGIPLKLK